MAFEFEVKHLLLDAEGVTAALLRMGAVPRDTKRQSDIYYSHPSRDFSRTDEAFRIRIEEIGRERKLYLTYKGPKIDTTAAGKSRIEYELEKVTDISDIIEFGVMITPALAVDGDVKSSGKLLSVDDIKGLLR